MSPLLQKHNNQKISMTDDLGHFKQHFSIDYIDYSILKDNKMSVYTSDNGKDLNQFIKDENDGFSHKLNGHGHLKWRDYCSLEFLTNLFNHSQLNSTGICTIIKHFDHTEYISLGTENKHLDLYHLCTHQSHQHQQMINRIRSIAHQFNTCCATILLPETHNGYKVPEETPVTIANKNFIYGLKGKTYLTSQEFHCIIGVGEMRTLKQIASEMNIVSVTSRTV